MSFVATRPDIAIRERRRTSVISLQRPALRHEEVFLRAVRKSKKLHKGLVSPPADSEAYRQYVRSLRQKNRILGLHRLEANIQPENERSIELVKAIGFSKEGYSPGYLKICGKWRDHERWAIRAEQWR